MSAAISTRLVLRPAACCPVCAAVDLRRDEVNHGGVLQLAECPRCLHRWTWREATRSGRDRRGAPARSPALALALVASPGAERVAQDAVDGVASAA